MFINMNLIENSKLKIEDIPYSCEEWDEVSKFARSYNGYGNHGGFSGVTEAASSESSASMSQLRAWLFLQWRGANHRGGWDNTPEGTAAVNGVLKAISKHIERGNFE